MDAFLLYIIKSTCCLGIFYLCYKILLSHEACFRFNRYVLLGGMITCLLLPLVELKTANPGLIQQPFIELERMISPEVVNPSPVQSTTTAVAPVVAEKEAAPNPALYLILYLIGCIVTSLWLVRSLISLFLLIHNGSRIRTNNYTIVLLNQPIPPFNWWKYIILSESDYRMYPDEIIAHEAAHCRRRHTLDQLLAEAIILLHWFNPAAWLLKRELQDVHEYEADTDVLNNGIDATKYQLLLVKKAVGSSSYTLANSFTQSKLKKRITMMCKNQTNKWARLKLLLLIPVTACTLYAFARPDVNRQLEQLIPSESTTNRQDNKQIDNQLFSSELKESLSSLSEKERVAWISQNTNKLDLFVNLNADILFCNEYATKAQLPAQLSARIQADYPNNKPVLIYLLIDKGAPTQAADSIKQIVANAIQSTTKMVNGKKREVYFYQGSPRLFSENRPVKVTLFAGNKTAMAFSVYGNAATKTSDIHIDQNELLYVTHVEIAAPEDTPMGVITDIKQGLHQFWDENNIDSSDLITEFKVLR